MDEPALRDVERWKDKIEVRLDNRQVFFLFFGSALVACMLFVLGVIVGKRIESRGRADAPEIQDPLAVLDRVNQPAPTATTPADQGLAFPKALIGTAGVKAKPLGLSPKPVAAPAPPSMPVSAKTSLASTTPSVPVVAATGSTRSIARPATAASVPATAPAARPSVAPRPFVAADPTARGKFTLQLSSYPDRGDADAFARRFASQGAFVITSEIPGKGVWYRVRVGNYASIQEATAAKSTFEKQHNVIAYVAAR